jgi:hypothetical protein
MAIWALVFLRFILTGASQKHFDKTLSNKQR